MFCFWIEDVIAKFKTLWSNHGIKVVNKKLALKANRIEFKAKNLEKSENNEFSFVFTEVAIKI